MPATILIVEDEADLSELMRYNLEAEGFRVVTAESGDEAVERIRDGVPDLILLDWMLPGLSRHRALPPLALARGNRAHADHHGHRARRGRGAGAGPRDRRRRLYGQAVLDARAGGPHPGAAAPLEPAAGHQSAEGRRSRARPPEPPRPPRRPRRAPRPDRIPAARIPDAPSRAASIRASNCSMASGATTSMSTSAPSTSMSAACAKPSTAAASTTRSAPSAAPATPSTSGSRRSAECKGRRTGALELGWR